MTEYYGDFAEDDTVNIPFNTFDSNDPTASVTITNLADADIHVHKDASITQATTDGATVVINFDGITGNHMISIDTSADAFYVTGSEYAVRIEGTTIDAGTINAWVGAFSIERAGGVLALIKAGNLSANVVQLGGATQSATDLKDFADDGYDPATNKVQGVVLVDTTTVSTDAEADIAALNDVAATDIVSAGAITTLSGAVVNVDLTDTLTTYTGNTVQTGDNFARLGSPAGASVSADIAVIEGQTDDIGIAGAGLTDITINQASVDAFWDEVLSKAAHNVGQSGAKFLRQSADLVQIAGAISDVAPSTSDFDTDLTQVDGFFDDSVLIFTNGSANAGIGITVNAYVNANGNMSFLSPDLWPVTPVNGDDFVIFATHVHPISQIQASILSDATPFQGADIPEILTDTGTTLPATLGTPTDTDLATDIANNKTVGDAIQAKTDDLTFTKANELDSNTQSINDAGVVGDGNATPWDGE